MASAALPIAAPKIEALPQLDVTAKIEKTEFKDVLAIVSSVTANFDHKGNGTIRISNYHDLTSRVPKAARAGMEKEFVEFEIKCDGDAAKINQVMRAYANMRVGIGNGSMPRSEKFEEGLRAISALAASTSKNDPACANMESRFKALHDEAVARGVNFTAPQYVDPDNVTHAINVLNNRHTLVFPHDGPAGSISEMKIVCDRKRTLLELTCKSTTLVFDLTDIANPIGDAEDLAQQGRKLVAKILDADGYLDLLKKEKAVGGHICNDSELFRALRGSERAVEFKNLSMTDASLMVRACDEGLKLTNVTMVGKNAAASLVVDGKVIAERVKASGVNHLHFNSKNSEFKSCEFHGTVITGDISQSTTSGGCMFKNVRLMAKAFGLKLDGQARASDWAGSYIHSDAFDDPSLVQGENRQKSDLEERLGLTPLDVARQDKITAEINRVFDNGGMWAPLKNENNYKVSFNDGHRSSFTVQIGETAIGTSRVTVTSAMEQGKVAYHVTIETFSPTEDDLLMGDTDSYWKKAITKKYRDASGAFTALYSGLTKFRMEDESPHYGFTTPQPDSAPQAAPGRGSADSEEMLRQMLAQAGGGDRGPRPPRGGGRGGPPRR